MQMVKDLRVQYKLHRKLSKRDPYTFGRPTILGFIKFELKHRSSTIRKISRWKQKKMLTIKRMIWRIEGRWESSKAKYALERFKVNVFTLFGLLQWVNVYETTRHYGGPEEGGWWYDWNQCAESRLLFFWQAEKVRDRLYGMYEDEGDISSVLGGKLYWIAIQDRKAENETKERPHYE
jgi:hypothetical protein